MSVLLILSVNGRFASKNWNWPQPIQSIIVDKREADVIQWMHKNYSNERVWFWIGSDFSCKLGDYKIKCVVEPELIDSFKKIYDDDNESSADLYSILKGQVKQLYREKIEKCITSDTEYDPEEDTLDLSKLLIKDDQLLVDSNQPLPE